MSSAQASFANDALRGSFGDEDLPKGEMPAGLESFAKGNMSSLYGIDWKLTGTPANPRWKLTAKDMDWYEEHKKRREANRRLLLSTTDNVIFRLYLTEMTEYDDPTYQRRFCKFMRCLSGTQTLHFHMGCGCYGWYPIYTYGCMVDAMQRTQGKVITHLNGRSSFSETILWLYGHERVVSEFTTITFKGLQGFLERGFANWRSYFETFFLRAMDLKLITKDEKDMLLTTNKILNLSYRDIIARIQTQDANVDDPENTPPME